MNDERKPATEPVGGWEQDPWIIIDDTVDGPGNNGWEPSATSQTWNGMDVSPPGAGARTERESASNAAFSAPPEAAPEDRSGWTAPVGDGLPLDVGEGVPARRALPAYRPPRPSADTLLPFLVTFAITCMGVLLVVSSIIWRPHVP
ncbi:hypothetical protein GCM10010191_10100 [Actinomadura vinacea]|uniref:Uncharacterized protein n=1 Tax=Actinomadura vinacea TaxID=115336 RepID=A0ABN3IGT0_9ACTN